MLLKNATPWKLGVSVLDCNLNLTYLTWILSSNDRKFRIFENMISKLLQTISKQLDSFLSKISRPFWNFMLQNKVCNSTDTMVKTQVSSSKVNTLFATYSWPKFSGLSWMVKRYYIQDILNILVEFWRRLRIASKITSCTFRSITQSNNAQSAEGKGEQRTMQNKLETNSVLGRRNKRLAR